MNIIVRRNVGLAWYIKPIKINKFIIIYFYSPYFPSTCDPAPALDYPAT